MQFTADAQAADACLHLFRGKNFNLDKHEKS